MNCDKYDTIQIESYEKFIEVYNNETSFDKLWNKLSVFYKN